MKCSFASFNPRVRGTCLVRAVRQVLHGVGERTVRFNPRVRGTCLVSCTILLMKALKTKGNKLFQSPCAGNMFGKFRFGIAYGHANLFPLVSIPVCGEHVW